jgi:hypothetical protein
MLKETTQRFDDAQVGLAEERRRARDLEKEQAHLRAQLVNMRSELSNAHSEGGKLRKELAEKEIDLHEKVKEASDANVRLGMLRTYVTENGVGVDEEEMLSKSKSNGAASPAALAEFESRLAERTRLHENSERELAQALRRNRDAEERINQISTQLDRLRSSQSADSQGGDSRAVEAERKLEETERGYKARMQQMEEDYQLAVHYVK